MVHEFLPLHFVPELDEVHNKERKNNDAEHEHVFRRPFNLRRTSVDHVTVVTTRAAVLDGEPACIDDVDDHERGQPDTCDEGIPVGAQELADKVVGCRPEDSHRIHQHVKRNKQNQAATREGHDELASYR